MLKNVFCYNFTQRGHVFSECKEKKNGPPKTFGKGNSGARVYSLQHEEAPTVDTLAGMFVVASHPAYVLIDTSAIYSCIYEDFMSACELCPKQMSSNAISVTSPLGMNSWTFDVVKSVEVVIDEVHMPIDMLVLFHV